jgi:hypothetical protein
MNFFPLIILLCLASCATKRTPEQALATALTYTELEWIPEQRHILHGKDSNDIAVHTPDSSLSLHGDDLGWWKPGVPAKGMAYKWAASTPRKVSYRGCGKGKSG